MRYKTLEGNKYNKTVVVWEEVTPRQWDDLGDERSILSLRAGGIALVKRVRSYDYDPETDGQDPDL
jgi:hypothetical protein